MRPSSNSLLSARKRSVQSSMSRVYAYGERKFFYLLSAGMGQLTLVEGSMICKVRTVGNRG